VDIKRKIKSSDNTEYELCIDEDAVELSSRQVEIIQEMAEEMKSVEIEEDGISLKHVPEEQSRQIIRAIEKVLKEFDSYEEIINSGVFDYTSHAAERINDTETVIYREWNPQDIDYEIAECLKRAYNVEQIRVRFNGETKKSWPRLGFRIRGSKDDDHGDRHDSQLVFHFDKDPIDQENTIMIITILKPDY